MIQCTCHIFACISSMEYLVQPHIPSSVGTTRTIRLHAAYHACVEMHTSRPSVALFSFSLFDIDQLHSARPSRSGYIRSLSSLYIRFHLLTSRPGAKVRLKNKTYTLFYSSDPSVYQNETNRLSYLTALCIGRPFQCACSTTKPRKPRTRARTAGTHHCSICRPYCSRTNIRQRSHLSQRPHQCAANTISDRDNPKFHRQYRQHRHHRHHKQQQ